MNWLFNDWNYQILPIVVEAIEIDENNNNHTLTNTNKKILQKNMRYIIEMEYYHLIHLNH